MNASSVDAKLKGKNSNHQSLHMRQSQNLFTNKFGNLSMYKRETNNSTLGKFPALNDDKDRKDMKNY